MRGAIEANVMNPKFKLLGLILVTSMSLNLLRTELVAQNEKNDMTTTSPIEGVKFHILKSNGLNMRIAEMGDAGPLVLLAHGWPESCHPSQLHPTRHA